MRKNYLFFSFPEKKGFLKNASLTVAFFMLSFFFSSALYAQADCSSAVVICGNSQSYNPSGIGSKLENLACGGIEHNSIWFAFQAKASGKLNFVIRPLTLDGQPTIADFDWSLFALSGPPGTTNCDNKTQLSCNFSGSATVYGIPGATGMATPNYTAAAFNPGVDVVVGNWYTIIVDQFSNTTPLLFNIQFTGNPESASLNSAPGIFDNKPDFTINTTAGCSGSYSFSNTSAATSGLASYLWNFGDGSTSVATAPSHTYAASGTYYVTLTATDNNGCKSEIRKAVVFNVSPPVVTSTGLFVTPSCSDSNNGTVTITTIGATATGVSGGTAPYSFELVSPSPMTRPSQGSNLFTGLQSGGYVVKVTDACGRSATGTFTVPQVGTNTAIGLGIQNLQASCGSTPTGSATLFANGTTPPYTMALVNSSPTPAPTQATLQRDPVTATYYGTFNNLLPGVYTLEATDGCGKIRRATFTVPTSTAPTVVAFNTASCLLNATGTISVSATAATGLSANGSPGSFQYALIAPSPIVRPFQNNSVFENLLPGTYTIAVKDSCGNIGTGTTTVAATAPTLGTSFTTLSCPNTPNGTIEAQIATAGGGSPYTFELVGPSPVLRPAQANNTFTGLPPGTYTIRLTDACGGQATTTSVVGSASAPSFTTTLTPSCNAASGTAVIIPAATSIGPFTFELISPGAAIRAPQGSNIANTKNSVFSGLGQGSYTVRMTDGCGVPVTGTITIGAPTALAFPTGSTTVPSCATGSTGQLTIAQPTTGSAPYQFETIAPSAVLVAPQASNVFNNLPVGAYTVRVTDACGTQTTIGTQLNITAATAPSLSVTNTSSCASNTGTITCLATTANQGGGTYLYALIAPSPVTRPNQASPIFTGLSAGAYTVQITDQCGLTGTTTTTIAAAGAFTPAAGGSVVGCNGTGYYSQIVVTNPQNYTPGGPIPAGSGGGPYTYAVYDATNTTLLAGPQSSNLFSTITPLAGSITHTVRVTDVCGNTSTTTLTLNPPTALSAATITAVTPSCAASNTGVIRVSTASVGGLLPYSYTLLDATTSAVVAGPQTSILFNGIGANATGYVIKTTDACGNVVTSVAPLLFPAATNPTATVTVTDSCVTASTGKLVVTPGTGATLAGGTFSYALYDSGNTVLISGPQASPVFSNVAAGTYTVRIIDRCGSIGTNSVTVGSGIVAPSAAGTASGSCTSGNNGVITAASTGGSLPVTYTLVNQVTSSIVAGPQSGNIFTGLASGTYIVRVTDVCGSATDSANIPLGGLSATPTITTSSAVDCGGSAILAGFGAAGNGGPFLYALCNGAGCTTFGTYSTANTFTVTSSGTYVISVKDLCGNTTNSSDIVVVIPTKPTITGVVKTTLCGPTTITPSFTGVTNTPYYSVDNANFSPTIGTLAAGTHTIRVSDYNAGVYGCASDPFTFSVDVASPPTANATQTFCSSTNPTVGGLQATGSSIRWYDAVSAGNLLSPSLALVNGNIYYASQTIGSCESTRTAVTVTVTPSTTNGSVTTSICSGGSYVWPLPSGTGSAYTTAQTNLNNTVGCNTATLNLTVTPLAATPTGSSTQSFNVAALNDATIASLTVSPSGVLWYGTLANAQAGTNALASTTVLTNGATYWAVNPGTCPSLPFAVTVTVTLGDEEFNSLNFNYHPNPTSSVLNISYDKLISDIQVSNLLGQTVMTKKTNERTVLLDLSGLAAATYLIKVTSEEKSTIIRVIKKD